MDVPFCYVCVSPFPVSDWPTPPEGNVSLDQQVHKHLLAFFFASLIKEQTLNVDLFLLFANVIHESRYSSFRTQVGEHVPLL